MTKLTRIEALLIAAMVALSLFWGSPQRAELGPPPFLNISELNYNLNISLPLLATLNETQKKAVNSSATPANLTLETLKLKENPIIQAFTALLAAISNAFSFLINGLRVPEGNAEGSTTTAHPFSLPIAVLALLATSLISVSAVLILWRKPSIPAHDEISVKEKRSGPAKPSPDRSLSVNRSSNLAARILNDLAVRASHKVGKPPSAVTHRECVEGAPNSELRDDIQKFVELYELVRFAGKDLKELLEEEGRKLVRALEGYK